MQVLVWAGTFMLLTFAGSTVALAGMIGLPIAVGIQFGLYAMTALVAGSGVVLWLTAPRALPVVSPLGAVT